MKDRRQLLARLGAAGAGIVAAPHIVPGTSAVAQDTQPRPSLRSVIDFGARGDGQTDDTAAFNRATQAAGPWREGLGSAINVPPGHYRVDGTIRLRKGQHLTGAGEATLIDATNARGTTILLGGGETGLSDPGGAPVGASNMRFLGGTGDHPVLRVVAEGFSLSNLFLSAAGTAIEVAGADGVIQNVIVDQALRGIAFHDAQNVVVQGLIGYLANYALSFGPSSNDIVIANAIFAYSRFTSVLLEEGANGIDAVSFANCNFVSNEGYPGFLGQVHARSVSSNVRFSTCNFRNWPGFAIRQEAGQDCTMVFDGCTFDGSRSRAAYAQNSGAGVLLAGAGSRTYLRNCDFRNLDREILHAGDLLAECRIEGGSIQDCRGHPIVAENGMRGIISVGRIAGFGYRTSVTTGSGIVLPWWQSGDAWEVTARSRGQNNGIETMRCAILRDRELYYIDEANLAKQGADLALTASFGETPGGPVDGRRPAGFVCISSPVEGLDWSVKTAI